MVLSDIQESKKPARQDSAIKIPHTNECSKTDCSILAYRHQVFLYIRQSYRTYIHTYTYIHKHTHCNTLTYTYI